MNCGPLSVITRVDELNWHENTWEPLMVTGNTHTEEVITLIHVEKVYTESVTIIDQISLPNVYS